MAQLHDRSPAAVTVEERIGWIYLCMWEMALDCGERCVKKIQWLASLRVLCHVQNNVPTHITVPEDLLNSMDTNLQSVVFFF